MRGITTYAGIPLSAAAHESAAAWLPDEWVATPPFASAVPTGKHLVSLYAVTPYEAFIGDPGASLSFANTAALAPGTTLDLLALGSLSWLDGPPAGTLGRIGAAHVSTDGKSITSDVPIRFLSWFALATQGPTP